MSKHVKDGKTVVLVAQDNGRCISQARFTPLGADDYVAPCDLTDAAKETTTRVRVLALEGCTGATNKVMARHEAHAYWKGLTDRGWVPPFNTEILSERTLKMHYYD